MAFDTLTVQIHRPFLPFLQPPLWCRAVGGADGVSDGSCIVPLLWSVWDAGFSLVTASSAAAEHSPPSPAIRSHYLNLYTHLHHSFPFFFHFSVCILHLCSLPSLLTEVGKLPSAGASSRCSLFLSLPPSLPLSCSLSLSLSLSLCSLALSVCTLCSVCACIFFPLLSRSLSLSSGSSGEAAVCASASQLPQVKTAASSDVANPTGGWGAFAAAVASSHPSAGLTFLIIFKKSSWREGRAEDPSNSTNKSQADWKEHRLWGTEEKTPLGKSESVGYF